MKNICLSWDELNGKTISNVTLHNHFDRNTIMFIFTDRTSAILESTVPDAEIQLRKE